MTDTKSCEEHLRTSALTRKTSLSPWECPSNVKTMLKAFSPRGTWLVQWIECATLNLRVVNSSPNVGRRDYLKIEISEKKKKNYQTNPDTRGSEGTLQNIMCIRERKQKGQP